VAPEIECMLWRVADFARVSADWALAVLLRLVAHQWTTAGTSDSISAVASFGGHQSLGGSRHRQAQRVGSSAHDV
jgi:hypothetical protein